jgi:hypothetical protein
MGVNTYKKHLATPHSPKKRRAATIAAILAAAALAQWKFSSDFNKQAKNNSKLRGKEWLDELLAGHLKHFYNSMGMNKPVFKKLLGELIQAGLHDTRYVTSEEQLAIFLYLAVTGLAQRHLEECFQRSPDIISK